MNMYLAGIDLGGTAIKAGLVDENLSLVCKTSIPTGVERGYVQVIRDMAGAVIRLAEENSIPANQIASVGIGIPGFARKGIATAVNLFWIDVPLQTEMKKYLDVPVIADNDATVAAVYEYHLGALKNCDVGVLLTLGTGLGSGIILGGKPYSGAHGMGAELGHIEIVPDGVPCICGNKGCLEAYTSATALIRQGRCCVVERPESRLYHLTQGDLAKVTAKLVLDCAKDGDNIALSIVDEFVKHLAMGIGTIENILDPDVIALGGGVSAAGDFLLKRVIKASENKGIFANQKYADITLAVSGNDAGVIGAAMLGLSLMQ